MAKSALIHCSVSALFNLPKHNADSPRRHLIALDPSHNLQAFPISSGLPLVCFSDNFPNNCKLHVEINGAQAAGPFVIKFSKTSCISVIDSSSGGFP